MKYFNSTRTLLLLILLPLFSIPIFASSQAAANSVTDNPDGSTQLYLPLVANTIQTSQLLNQVQGSHDFTDQLPLPPPVANSYTFVTSSGGDLDQYLGRNSLANGRLSFQVGVGETLWQASTILDAKQ